MTHNIGLVHGKYPGLHVRMQNKLEDMHDEAALLRQHVIGMQI